MADNFRFSQLQSFSLNGAGAIIGDTTITLKSMKDIDGGTLTMAGDFGTIGFGTLEPGSGTLEEQISFTGLTNNANGTTTLTGVKHVLFLYPYTATAGLAKTHAGSTTFIISNTSGFYDQLTSKSDDETVTGLWDFPSGANNPTIGNVTYVAPTTDTQIATKKYVDDIAIAGSPDATLTVKGIVEIATTAEIDAGTTFGGTGASLTVRPDQLALSLYATRLPTVGQKAALVGNNTDVAIGAGNKYVTQTGLQHSTEIYAASATGNDTYVVTLSPAPTSYTNGMTIRFKTDVANTGAASLNVNGLGAITIKKNVSVDLVTGDVLANEILTVVYDGTNFQMLNAPAGISSLVGIYKNGADTKNSADASTTQNIAHGLGVTPKSITIDAYAQSAATAVFIQARTVYNGTTQTSFSGYGSGNNGTVATTFTLNSTAASAGNDQTGIVTFDATNIIITWTKTGNPTGTYNLVWTAVA